MKNEHILNRLVELDDEWNIEAGLSGDESIRAKGLSEDTVYKLRKAEGVIHEMAHATCLDIPFGRRMATRTANHFYSIESGVIGLTYEVQAFAVQRRVLRNYGWLRYIDFDRLMKDVRENGFSGPAYSFKTLKTLLRAYEKDQVFHNHVEKITNYLEGRR